MSYEIAVACDVALGKSVQSNPTVNQIDIDPFAIESVLTELAPEIQPGEVRTLLFIACHFDSVQEKSMETSHISGSFQTAKRSSYDVPTAKVVVAGDPINYQVNESREFSQAFEDAMDADRASATAMQVVNVVRQYSSVATFERAKSTQETAVHEICHAADKLNKQIRAANIRYHSKNLINKTIFSLSAYAMTFAGLRMASDAAETAINPYAESGSIIALSYVASRLAVKYWTKDSYKNYLGIPDEIRARAAEKNSSQYQQIIRYS
jgi:hypothetical protein